MGDTVDRRSMRIDRPSVSDLMPVESGGKNWEFKYEARCRVCASGEDILRMVNSLLGAGHTYRDVLRAIAAVNKTLPPKRQITYNSISTHQKRHMPFEAQAVRDIIEKRAAAAQKDFIDGEGTILTPAAYAEVMMKKAFDGLLKEGTEVSISEGLSAAKTLHSLTKDEQGSMEAAAAVMQLNKILEAVKLVASPEQIQKIVAILDGEEVMEERHADEIDDAELADDDNDDEPFDPDEDEDDRDDIGS